MYSFNVFLEDDMVKHCLDQKALTWYRSCVLGIAVLSGLR